MSLVDASAIQFAVVREDATIECAIVHELERRSALLVASGGCTALALASACPELAQTLVDPNPAQLELVRRKASLLSDREVPPSRFGVGNDDPTALHECGNFERLFRLLRHVLDLFVVASTERARRFETDEAWDDVFDTPYWPRAFELAFSEGMLVTMFGPAAIQHAAPGSYPEYFRGRIEAALRRDDRSSNPYLHHLLLGRYSAEPAAWPEYLRLRADFGAGFAPEIVRGTLLDIRSFEPFDFVGLSNVMDWMDDDACTELAKRLADELQPGAAVLWRQLNDPRDLLGRFDTAFEFDADRDARLLARERSAFYDAVHLGLRR
ncbi:MAG: DUF3419 family protein [Planctomycetes bacterium]|nr:DUF3419 family protein [Planctomycetota bacterium]